MARQRAPLDKRKKAFSDIVGCLSFVLFAIALFISYRANPYPPVQRSGSFFQAPSLLFCVCLIWVTLFVVPLNIWIQKRTGVSGHGFTLAVYLALGIPVLLGLSRLGLYINGALDKSNPQSFSTVVINKKGLTSKGSTSWYLDVRDWRNPPGKVRLSATKSQYDTLAIGSALPVVTKSGFLGYEWLISPTWS